MTVYFSGWQKLLRLNLRRDRWQILFWLIGIAGLSIAVAGAFPELFPTAQERQVMAETVKNPAMIAMIGPSSSLNNYTIGAMFGHEMTLFMAITTAVMMILLTARHTRGDEEDGRLEMIRALSVGRLAPLIAVLVEMLLISVLIMLTNGIGVGLLGIETMPMGASLLYGAALGSAGLVFTGVTAVFAQLAESKRGTVGFSLSFLGAAYLFRGFTDLNNESLSWLSPLSWVYKTEVFVTNSWFPIILSLVFSFILFGVSFYLNSIRDLEAGFIPQRSGKSHAGFLLKKPLGFSFRLVKTTLISWLVVMVVAGISYGSVFGDLENFFKSSDILTMLLPEKSNYSLTEQFMTVLMVILSILGTIPVLTVALKAYSEEKKSRVMAEPIGLSMMLKSGLAYLPAVWFVMGAGFLLVGWLPKWSGAVWFYLVFSFFVDYLGSLLDVPKVVKNLSVFSYIPRIPVDSFEWQPLLVITGLAVLLLIGGFIGYRNRDIAG